MTPIPRLGYLALALSLVTGCEGRAASEDVAPPIPEESYVAVMAELARVRRRPPRARGQLERDRLADSLRTEVLESHGITAAELVDFADAVGSDPGRMQALAERIESLADSLEVGSVGADSIRADSGVSRAAEEAAADQRTDPETRFGNPDLEPPAEPAIRVEIPAAADTAGGIELTPSADSATPRPRPDDSRLPNQRPPKTPAPDTANEQSNHGATGDKNEAV